MFRNAPEWPGQVEYRGAEAVVRFLQEEVVNVIELGEVELGHLEVIGDEIVIRMVARTRGAESQVDIGMIPVFHVAHMRDGRVSRVRAYLDEGQAIEAARAGIG